MVNKDQQGVSLTPQQQQGTPHNNSASYHYHTKHYYINHP
jgi:hypothetical protein